MSLRGSILVALVGVAALASDATTAAVDPAAADGQVLRQFSRGVSAVAKRAMPGVVFIQVEKTMGAGDEESTYNDPRELFEEEFLRRFFGAPVPPRGARKFRQVGQGTGFIITKDGYILTNNHVVGDADKVTVKLHDGRQLVAKRVGSDPKSEVAVIKIDARDLPVIELGDSAALEVGELVLAIGNPFGLAETITVGVVSAKGRSNIGIADYEDFIQTDAAINPGNSGGPLLNTEGKAVGINTAIFSRSGGYMGIGFAIPVNMVRSIKDQLIQSGRVTRGYLGVMIQDVTPEIAGSFGLKEPAGVLVSEVTAGSPAEQAGLKAGDVVLQMSGQPVVGVGAFRNAVAMTAPGARLALLVHRDGKERKVEVPVGSLPGDAPEPAVAIVDKLGMAIEDLTREVAQRFGYAFEKGVIITRVDEGTAAEAAGLQAGMVITGVNRRDVANTAEFRQALAGADPAGRVLLLVRDPQGARYVVIAIR